MLKHLDFGKHEYQATKSSRLAKVKEQWVQRFVGESADSRTLPGCSKDVDIQIGVVAENCLEMGWAIPKRAFRRYEIYQAVKNYL